MAEDRREESGFHGRPWLEGVLLGPGLSSSDPAKLGGRSELWPGMAPGWREVLRLISALLDVVVAVVAVALEDGDREGELCEFGVLKGL